MSSPLSVTDREFLKRFAALTASLHVGAGCLLLLAYSIYVRHPPSRAPAGQQDVLVARIAPVGAVYSGETGRAAAAAQQRAQQAGTAKVAFGGSTDGKVIFDNVCHVCHETGLAGAPKVGDAAAWKPRIAKGKDTLFAHAIGGFQGNAGVMPAKGGDPALSDAQVKAAVEWMIGQVK